jgi:hypothetical protein
MVHVDVDAKLVHALVSPPTLRGGFAHTWIGVAGWAPMSVSPPAGSRTIRFHQTPRLRDIKALLDQRGRQFQVAVGKLDGYPEMARRFTITDERARQAIIVAAENAPGVKSVRDRLAYLDMMSGMLFPPSSEEQRRPSTVKLQGFQRHDSIVGRL